VLIFPLGYFDLVRSGLWWLYLSTAGCSSKLKRLQFTCKYSTVLTM